jgi:hypothetical protein
MKHQDIQRIQNDYDGISSDDDEYDVRLHHDEYSSNAEEEDEDEEEEEEEEEDDDDEDVDYDDEEATAAAAAAVAHDDDDEDAGENNQVHSRKHDFQLEWDDAAIQCGSKQV